MRMPRTQTVLLLLVCLSLGMSLILPFFDHRWTVEATIFGDNSNTSGGTTTAANNTMYGSEFKVMKNGNITALNIYGRPDPSTDTVNISIGVYAWTSNTSAGALLGHTVQVKVSPTSYTWTTLSMTTPLSVTAGTRYFLIFYAGNATGHGVNGFRIGVHGSGHGVQKTSGLTFPTFPDPFSATSTNAYNFALYATYTESGSGTPTIPSSSVNSISPYWNKASLSITATASDPADDGLFAFNVKNVSLYYRYSTDNSTWGGYTNFGTVQYVSGSPAWSWTFTFTNGSGYYQFYSIAKDVDGNTESAPGTADQVAGYDNVAPASSVDALAHTQTSSPIMVTVTAVDTGGSGLKDVRLWYRSSSDNSTWGSYTDYGVVSSAPYSWSFSLTTLTYYQFYSIANDNAGNQETNYTQTMGDATIESSEYGNNPNYLRGSWFTFSPSHNLPVSSITAYCRVTTTTSMNVSFAIYQWVANNDAGSLLATSYETKITSTSYSWVTLNLKTPLTLTAGSKYFLVFFCGNRSGTTGLSIRYKTVTADGIQKITGLTYPTFPNPLTGESDINLQFSIYTSFIEYDQDIYANLRAWTQKQTGYNTFGNIASWTNKVTGYNLFGNTASWLTKTSGWNSFWAARGWFNATTGYTRFGNLSTWKDILHDPLMDWDFNHNGIVDWGDASDDTPDTIIYHYGESGSPGWLACDCNLGSPYHGDGTIDYLDASAFSSYAPVGHTPMFWSTFGNVSTMQTIQQGWSVFGNTASWLDTILGWSVFGNVSTMQTVQDGWSRFGNISTYQTVVEGYSTFGNGSWSNQATGWSSFNNTGIWWQTITSGWTLFGNTSTYQGIDQGWSRFGNQSYMVIISVYPENGSLVCPTCYNDNASDTAMVFAVNVSHTNGTHMTITWRTWNGTILGQLTGMGNGTHHITPSEDVMVYPYAGHFNYTVAVTDGAATITRTISFGTDTEVNCMQFFWNISQFGLLIVLALFIFFFYVGYTGKKRSAGAFLLVSGFLLLGICAGSYSQVPILVVGIIIAVSLFIILLGINKWFFKPANSTDTVQGH